MAKCSVLPFDDQSIENKISPTFGSVVNFEPPGPKTHLKIGFSFFGEGGEFLKNSKKRMKTVVL